MSLARAFTTRRNRADKPGAGFIARATSQRSPVKARPQISGPINLISSTNVLSFDAPNIVGTAPMPLAHEQSGSSSASDTSSRSSVDHSDASSTGPRDYLTDASSISSSPNSPEPNHLSCYFKPSVYTDTPSRSNSMRSHTSQPSFDAPAIPQRAASHSKRAHVRVSRQRSVSRIRTPPSPVQEVSQYQPEQSHPFGKELEQLNEVVEDFGGVVVRDAAADADHHFMEAHDLGIFCASDYMMEIQDLLPGAFAEDRVQVGWI